MRIYREYFDMLASGAKTIEIRVGYPSMRSIEVGDVIRFNNDPSCRCRVTRISIYGTFAEMMATEDPRKINPYKSAEEQLADIRSIFPPEKEALGVLAFELCRI